MPTWKDVFVKWVHFFWFSKSPWKRTKHYTESVFCHTDNAHLYINLYIWRYVIMILPSTYEDTPSFISPLTAAYSTTDEEAKHDPQAPPGEYSVNTHQLNTFLVSQCILDMSLVPSLCPCFISPLTPSWWRRSPPCSADWGLTGRWRHTQRSPAQRCLQTTK